MSDSGEEDNAPEIEFSEYELPPLLSDSDDEDDVIDSERTKVTDVPLASNDDALRSSSENDDDVVENSDCIGSGGGTDEPDKDWSPARQNRKMKPKKRRKYAARVKKPFCELKKKTIQKRKSELGKFAASPNLSHMVVGSVSSKQGLPVRKENDAANRVRAAKATLELTKRALLAKLDSKDT